MEEGTGVRAENGNKTEVVNGIKDVRRDENEEGKGEPAWEDERAGEEGKEKSEGEQNEKDNTG